MQCHNCNHRIFGLGCLLTNKRVTDHEHCNQWEPIKPDKPENDRDAVNQYHQAGYILKLGA